MAILTATAGIGSMGRDLTISVTGIDGTPAFSPAQILSVDYRQVTMDITKTLCNAHTILADLPRYWEGTIEMVRGYPDVDDYFSNLEALWLDAQQADFTLGNIMITVTTKYETTTMVFEDASIKFEDSSWKAEDLTTMRIAFRAGRRIVS